MQKPSEALPSQVFQGHRAGKVFILLFDQSTKGHIRSPKGTVPFGSGLARTVVINRFVFLKYGGHSVQLT